MKYYSHIAGAILFFLIFAYLAGINNPLMGIIIAALASLFPDLIDKITGKHRGIGHSIIWLIPFSLVGLLNIVMAAAMLIGFISHLFLDFFTVYGCPILYPLRETGFHCLKKKREIKTGTNQEKSVFIFILCLVLPLLFLNFNLVPPLDGLMGDGHGLAYAGGNTSSLTETIKSDINLYFNLNEANNKNLTIQKSGNTTTILIKDIVEENKVG